MQKFFPILILALFWFNLGLSAHAQSNIANPFSNFNIRIPGIEQLAGQSTAPSGSGQSYNVPWIGQYVQSIYGFALAIVGITAVVAIAIGGLLWVLSAGNPGKISKAKSWIQDALIGLALVFCSYLLLATINKELVFFRAINIQLIQRGADAEIAEFNGVTIKKGGSESQVNIDEEEKNTNTGKNDGTKGCYDENKTIACNQENTGASCQGNATKIAPEVASGLKTVAKIAKEKYGLDLVITSAFRSLADQQKLWDANPDPTWVARPSCNAPHVRGVAVDVWPSVKNSENILNMQKAFAEAGWTRYGGECWHFQRPGAPANRPGQPGDWTSGQCYGIAAPK